MEGAQHAREAHERAQAILDMRAGSFRRTIGARRAGVRWAGGRAGARVANSTASARRVRVFGEGGRDFRCRTRACCAAIHAASSADMAAWRAGSRLVALCVQDCVR